MDIKDLVGQLAAADSAIKSLQSPSRLAIAGNLAVNPAKHAHQTVAKLIRVFEESLDEEHEVGARLVSHASGSVFHIEDMGYWGPDLITFSGTDETGQRVQLIQNVTQISILLLALKKRGATAQRVGFKLAAEEPDR